MFTLFGHGLIIFSELTNLFLNDEKLHFKNLECERDFRILQKQFETADGIRLPVDYLKQGRSFICFNSNLEPQGGFALIERGPFRALQQIPNEEIAPVDSSVSEMTAVCLSPGNALRRTRYWSYVVGKTLVGDSQKIIYAVDADKAALREGVFNHIRSHVLYEGPVKKLEGMANESVEAVELATKLSLARGFVKLAIKETKKIKRLIEIRPKAIPEPV